MMLPTKSGAVKEWTTHEVVSVVWVKIRGKENYDFGEHKPGSVEDPEYPTAHMKLLKEIGRKPHEVQ